MKAKEIREQTTEEIVARIKDERNTYQKLILNHAVSSIESPAKIKNTRRNIAVLETVLRERQIEEQAKN